MILARMRERYSGARGHGGYSPMEDRGTNFPNLVIDFLELTTGPCPPWPYEPLYSVDAPHAPLAQRELQNLTYCIVLNCRI